MSATADAALPAVDHPATDPKRHASRGDIRPKPQPPFALIVENDDKHTFLYVIEVLQRVCGHDKEKAFQLAEQIHDTGRAVVWSGTLELAELKRDQIRGFGPDFYASQTVQFPLGVTIEPMPG